jgi:hypothetical protein
MMSDTKEVLWEGQALLMRARIRGAELYPIIEQQPYIDSPWTDRGVSTQKLMVLAYHLARELRAASEENKRLSAISNELEPYVDSARELVKLLIDYRPPTKGGWDPADMLRDLIAELVAVREESAAKDNTIERLHRDHQVEVSAVKTAQTITATAQASAEDAKRGDDLPTEEGRDGRSQ